MKMPKCNGTLKRLRLDAKLSQNGLARKAELDRTTISNAERGAEVSELTLSKIISALRAELGKEVKEEQLLA
tara:strand:+ start:251 stop:466 length:216 start_codon:yes stop_codon:yes gene_type:complete